MKNDRPTNRKENYQTKWPEDRKKTAPPATNEQREQVVDSLANPDFWLKYRRTFPGVFIGHSSFQIINHRYPIQLPGGPFQFFLTCQEISFDSALLDRPLVFFLTYDDNTMTKGSTVIANNTPTSVPCSPTRTVKKKKLIRVIRTSGLEADVSKLDPDIQVAVRKWQSEHSHTDGDDDDDNSDLLGSSSFHGCDPDGTTVTTGNKRISVMRVAKHHKDNNADGERATTSRGRGKRIESDKDAIQRSLSLGRRSVKVTKVAKGTGAPSANNRARSLSRGPPNRQRNHRNENTDQLNYSASKSRHPKESSTGDRRSRSRVRRPQSNDAANRTIPSSQSKQRVARKDETNAPRSKSHGPPKQRPTEEESKASKTVNPKSTNVASPVPQNNNLAKKIRSQSVGAVRRQTAPKSPKTSAPKSPKPTTSPRRSRSRVRRPTPNGTHRSKPPEPRKSPKTPPTHASIARLSGSGDRQVENVGISHDQFELLRQKFQQ